MRDVNIKAVILGVVASLAVLLVLSAVLFTVFGGHLIDSGMSDAEFEVAVNELLLTPVVMFWVFVAGAAATAFGAFTTARVAKGALFANTAAYLGVSVVLSLVVSDYTFPLWAEVLSYVLMPPAAYAGVYAASRRWSPSA